MLSVRIGVEISAAEPALVIGRLDLFGAVEADAEVVRDTGHAPRGRPELHR